jgi:hypothetical protein
MESIDALVNIITSGVSELKGIYSDEALAYPSLDDPYKPSSAEAKTTKTTETIVSAALQLIATVRSPALAVLSSTFLVRVLVIFAVFINDMLCLTAR